MKIKLSMENRQQYHVIFFGYKQVTHVTNNQKSSLKLIIQIENNWGTLQRVVAEARDRDNWKSKHTIEIKRYLQFFSECTYTSMTMHTIQMQTLLRRNIHHNLERIS